jgi:hypothetical protein
MASGGGAVVNAVELISASIRYTNNNVNVVEEKPTASTISSNTDAKSAKEVQYALTIKFDTRVLNAEGRGYAYIIDDVRIADSAWVHLSVIITEQSQCAWNARPMYVYTSESKVTVWTVEALQSVSIRCHVDIA